MLKKHRPKNENAENANTQAVFLFSFSVLNDLCKDRQKTIYYKRKNNNFTNIFLRKKLYNIIT